MTISRDVVYDLLPGYFAGDLSADSGALVEEWLRTDQEFAAMADRFKRLLARGAAATPAGTAERAEADTLSKARRAAQRRGEFRGLAIAYALATLVVLGAGASGFRPGKAWVIGAAFGVTAAICASGWYLSGRRPEWFSNPQYWGE